jgi:predicted short-subunit dehydrogenase-like oxidoreductase (DUF2520 family)
MKPALVLIGPGRVGSALGQLLHMAGYPIAAIIGRDRLRAEAAALFIGCDKNVATTDLQTAACGDILLLTLPDAQLDQFSSRLQEQVELKAGATLIHCSGLHPAAVLKPTRNDIASLSLHPLLPFADRQRAVDGLKNCPCALEGDQERLALGQELVQALGGHAFLLPSEAKQIYHAAASIASNFMVSLTACARDLLGDCGFEPQQAMQLLTPLHQATSTNILELGPEQALTGPIVRGDTQTVAIHLKALQSQSVEVTELYRTMAVATLRLAQKSGRLSADQAEELSRLLEDQRVSSP